MDLYGRLLAKVLFPGWERARGRTTMDVLAYLRETERASAAELEVIQSGLLRRLVRHAYQHTAHYRAVMDAAGVKPDDLRSPADLARLPLLEKATARATGPAREATAPPFAEVVKTTSGTTGTPMIVKYNAESRVWRDATRWRGYGWAGYQPGHKAFHWWGVLATPPTGWKKYKVELDHALRRDHYMDCSPRDDAHLARAVEALRRLQPDVMLAYAQGAAALARFVNRTGGRAWRDLPVITGAERLWPHDREAMQQAFGPEVFETYGCREVMLIASECEAHDGLHLSMETMIVELLVREGDTTRPARPGETGEVVITDLHNLAQPLIRYVGGDSAVARGPEPCRCGRTLPRIGPIEGRVTDTLRDGKGNPVNGLLFSILFVSIVDHATQFQIFQKKTGELSLRIVPTTGGKMPAAAEQLALDFLRKYLPGVPVTIDYVDDIPVGAAGKRHIVVVER
ncbi:MAG: phenylacetate--CoA ligase family protein [Kofleriaceae bacterium]|nr:phenylacetate--CoA ligase family protein [Kofleriaceae bacterium]MCL4227931.1 AMP-binding protein [Myxococcales bacterium]